MKKGKKDKIKQQRRGEKKRESRVTSKTELRMQDDSLQGFLRRRDGVQKEKPNLEGAKNKEVARENFQSCDKVCRGADRLPRLAPGRVWVWGRSCFRREDPETRKNLWRIYPATVLSIIAVS